MKLICVAMVKECSHFISLFELKKVRENIFINDEVVICITGIGKVNASMWTQYCLCNFPIDTVFNYGFAGSMTDDFKCGDFVVPKYVLQHDFDLTCFGYKIGEVQDQEVSYIPIKEEAFSISKKYNPDVKQAEYLLTGDKFMTERIEVFKNSICDMEGYGVARVANSSNIPAVILKLITDSCNKDGQDEYFKSIELYKMKMQDTLYEFINLLKN